MADLVSVIVTTYNRPDALAAVLRSLARQTERNFEVIVADDGSGRDRALIQRMGAAHACPAAARVARGPRLSRRGNPQSGDPCEQRNAISSFSTATAWRGRISSRCTASSPSRAGSSPATASCCRGVDRAHPGGGPGAGTMGVCELARAARAAAVNRFAPLLVLVSGPAQAAPAPLAECARATWRSGAPTSTRGRFRCRLRRLGPGRQRPLHPRDPRRHRPQGRAASGACAAPVASRRRSRVAAENDRRLDAAPSPAGSRRGRAYPARTGSARTHSLIGDASAGLWQPWV